jgi:hypothetical protein
MAQLLYPTTDFIGNCWGNMVTVLMAIQHNKKVATARANHCVSLKSTMKMYTTLYPDTINTLHVFYPMVRTRVFLSRNSLMSCLYIYFIFECCYPTQESHLHPGPTLTEHILGSVYTTVEKSTGHEKKGRFSIVIGRKCNS